MIKIRVIYDDERELAEVIKLLSPRLNFCRKTDDKRCFLGIETADLLVDDDAAENPDDTEEEVDYGGI